MQQKTLPEIFEVSSFARTVNANQCRSYEVQLVDDLIGENLELLTRHLIGRDVLLVTTPTVAKLYGDELVERLHERSPGISLLVLNATEQTKNMDNVLSICREAQRRQFGRQAMLVGLGGGVCTDLVTMAASLIRRGIPYIRIPTTLLGQVDGSIGVKGAVNFEQKKNSLGCYYSPRAVFVDPAFLRTLSTDQISLGISEIVKMALVRDSRLFDLVEQHAAELIDSRFQSPRKPAIEVIRRAIIGMIEELETNMYEDQTYKRLVDFGHTMSPALEAASQFSVPHGDAVAISMAFCCELAAELGHMTPSDCQRAVRCLQDCKLPVSANAVTEELVQRAFAEAMRHRAGRLNLVIPTTIGSATFVESESNLPPSAISNVVRRIRLRSSDRADDSAVRIRSEGSNIHLVFDIGGTNLRAAIYDPNTKQLVKRRSRPTPNHRRHPELAPDDIVRFVLQDMDDLAEELLAGKAPQSAAIAFAGPLNENHQITAAPTVWGTSTGEPVDLLADLQALWPTPKIHVFNDVTAAGYRYLRDHNESLCMVTVGSGIGNKIFINGRPFTGCHGRGGEIGHIVVDPDDDAVVCDCGERGHLGGIASGRGTLATAIRWAQRDPASFFESALGELSRGQVMAVENENIVTAFHDGDAWTSRLIEYVAGKLGNVLAQIHQSLGIERFIIFGGFGTALGERYRRFLVAAAERDCWSSGQDWNRMIELGTNDDDSGLLGAGRYAAEFSEVTA